MVRWRRPDSVTPAGPRDPRAPRLFRFVIRYVTPLFIAVVFVGALIQPASGNVTGALVQDATRLVLLAVFVGLALLVRYDGGEGDGDGDRDGAA